jgi:hypothetical protein
MGKLDWFLIGCLMAAPAYQLGKGHGLAWAERLYGRRALPTTGEL